MFRTCKDLQHKEKARSVTTRVCYGTAAEAEEDPNTTEGSGV